MSAWESAAIEFYALPSLNPRGFATNKKELVIINQLYRKILGGLYIYRVSVDLITAGQSLRMTRLSIKQWENRLNLGTLQSFL